MPLRLKPKWLGKTMSRNLRVQLKMFVGRSLALLLPDRDWTCLQSAQSAMLPHAAAVAEEWAIRKAYTPTDFQEGK
jgi:hypothetical protein